VDVRIATAILAALKIQLIHW